MTTDIEKEFFKTFGIKHKCKRGKIVCAGQANNKCPTCQNNIYPEITDKVLLELVCVIYQSQDYDLKIDELRQDILEQCLKYKDDIDKHQIQQLFKEEE